MSFLLLLFFVSLCWTQEAIKLDLNKAYELALKNNPEIKRATLELDSFDAKETESKLFFMPRAVLGAGLIYNSKSEEWEKPFGVSFVSVLYEYRKTLPRIRSAKLRAQAQREVKRQLERDLKIKLLELFAQASLWEKLTEVKREEMAIAYVRFDRAVQRKELGLATDVEVARLEMVYRDKRAELRRAQFQYNQTLYRIKKLVGLKMDEYITLESLSFEPKRGSLDKEKLLKVGIENSPLLTIKRINLALYEERLKEANNLFDLRVQLRGEVGYSIRTGVPQTRAYNQTGWRAGIEVLLPLFDPSTPFNLIELENQKRGVLVEIEDSLKELELLINSADYEYSYLLSKLDYALAKDKYAEENLTLRRSEYELELAFDLGYAMAEKTEAEMEIMRVKYEIMLFLAKLYSLVGLDPFLALEDRHGFVKPN
jgi:outer membrane protein TolC